MSEPTSDALFGVDGTQAPEPVEWGSWQDPPELPPMYLPPVPDERAMQEAVAAALGEDSGGGEDQEPTATQAPPAGGSPAGGSPVPPAEPVPPPTEPSASVGTSPSPPSVPRTQVAIAPTPVPLVHPRRPARLRYRPPMAAGFRRPMPPAVIRRRIAHERPGMRRQSTANAVLGVGLFVAFIIVVVLLYNIIIGILESLSRLFS